MCFRPIDSVVCVRLFGVLKNLAHISVALHLSVIMVLSDGSAEVTQEAVNTGAFSSFVRFFFCGARLHFYREKLSAVPFPRQQVFSRFARELVALKCLVQT